MGVPEGKKNEKRGIKIVRNLTRSTKGSYSNKSHQTVILIDIKMAIMVITQKEHVTTYLFSFVIFIDILKIIP